MQNVISNPMNIFTIFVYITFVNCDYKQISCVDKWKCPISTPPHPINQMCRITLTVWKLFHTFAHQIIAGEVILSTSELFFTGCVSNIYMKAQAADACRYRQQQNQTPPRLSLLHSQENVCLHILIVLSLSEVSQIDSFLIYKQKEMWRIFELN